MKQFITHIRDKRGPCSYQELEEYFVDRLGYDVRTISWLIYQDGVYRYLPSCLIHKDTIKWNDTKQNQLEHIASDIYKQASRAGKCYALIGDLLELESLPMLAEGIVWTTPLLADMLAGTKNFSILGNNRNAYITTPNKFGIETLEDLIYQLLKDNYGGASNLTSFENELTRVGIIKRSIKTSMLDDSKKVSIIGKEIILTELTDA